MDVESRNKKRITEHPYPYSGGEGESGEYGGEGGA